MVHRVIKSWTLLKRLSMRVSIRHCVKCWGLKQERWLVGSLRNTQTNLYPENIRCSAMSYNRDWHPVLKDAREWSS